VSTGKVILATVLAGVLGTGAALLGQRWLGEGRSLNVAIPKLMGPTDDRLLSLPEFSLPDVSGRPVASSDWAGKVVVLNFWATWCPPCLREMPVLTEAQERYGNLQVVGIAVDRDEDVVRFLEEHPVNYPVLIGSTEAIEMSRRLGNRLEGLPFTAIFDQEGNRVHGQIGEFTRASLERRLAPLLAGGSGTQTVGN
jgi:thiol-disulfide isomerase/thioredoxin